MGGPLCCIKSVTYPRAWPECRDPDVAPNLVWVYTGPMGVARYLHLLGAAVWVGGLIVVAALIPAVRRATPDREVIRAIARRFGVVSWIALGTQVLTGTWMVANRAWSDALVVKIGLVIVSAGLAGWHTVSARGQSPAVRGAIQGVILLLALAIVWVAIRV